MPSARPLVSRMTCPTIGPIAFALPWRTRSAASALAASAAATIAGELLAAVHRREALGLDDRRGSPPSATAGRAPAGRRRRSPAWRPTRPTSAASAAGATREAAGSSPSPRRASSSPVIQLASACGGGGGLGAGGQRGLEVVAELAAEGEQLRALGAQAELALAGARRARRAARTSPRARPASIASSIATGHEVGLGEVAVVVRLLLGAQRGDRAGGGVEVQRLLARPARPPARIFSWRAISARMPRSMKRKEFMFFSSVFTPSSLAAGRAQRDVGVAAQRALLHVHVADAELAQRACAAAAATRRPARRVRRSGSVTISASGVPPRLKSTMLGVRAVDAPARADVDQLGGVLLEVHAVDAHLAEPARRGTAARRTGRSGSPWAGRDRSSSCGGRSSAARARSRAPGRSSARSAPRARWPPAGSRAGRGRPGRCACWAARRRTARSRRTSSWPVASWTWISRPMTGS